MTHLDAVSLRVRCWCVGEHGVGERLARTIARETKGPGVVDEPRILAKEGPVVLVECVENQALAE